MDEEYECSNFIISDDTVYNRSDMDEGEEWYTVQSLVEGGVVDLEEIAAIFAKEVEYYRPQYEELSSDSGNNVLRNGGF